MNRIPYKVRLWIGIVLMLASITVFIAAIICGSYNAPIVILIIGPILAAIMFIVGVIFVPKTNEDGTPIVVKKNNQTKKPKKPKKKRKPFISDKEWREQEEEDDEMVYIEEAVEDD